MKRIYQANAKGSRTLKMMHIMTFGGQFEPVAKNVSECTAFNICGHGGNQPQ